MPLWNVDTPPLAPAYLSSYLKQQGFSVEVFDFNILSFVNADIEGKSFFESHRFQLWQDKVQLEKIITHLGLRKSFDKWAKKIKERKCSTVGFSCYYSNSLVTLYFVDFLKKCNPDIKIVIGGPSADLIYADIGNKENVTCIVGEGEKQLLNFINGVDSESKIDAKDCYVKHLDQIEYPSFEEFDLSSYRKDTLPILMGRGCLFFCSFCGARPLWPVYRSRSAQNVYDEIVFLKNRYGRCDFEIIDAALNCDMDILTKLCNLLIENNVDIVWGAKAVIRKEMDLPFLRLLYKSGCRWLAYGIESGSDKVLKHMGKISSANLCSKVLKNTKKSGISVSAFFIVGYPTETRIDFLKTLWFVVKNIRYIGDIQSAQKCGIPENSKLRANADELGIVFEADGWHLGKNTPAERELRQNIFKKVVSFFPRRKIAHS